MSAVFFGKEGCKNIRPSEAPLRLKQLLLSTQSAQRADGRKSGDQNAFLQGRCKSYIGVFDASPARFNKEIGPKTFSSLNVTFTSHLSTVANPSATFTSTLSTLRRPRCNFYNGLCDAVLVDFLVKSGWRRVETPVVILTSTLSKRRQVIVKVTSGLETHVKSTGISELQRIFARDRP